MRFSHMLAAHPPVRYAIAHRIAILVVGALVSCRISSAEVRRGFVTAVQDVRVPSTTVGVISRLNARLGDHIENGDFVGP